MFGQKMAARCVRLDMFVRLHALYHVHKEHIIVSGAKDVNYVRQEPLVLRRGERACVDPALWIIFVLTPRGESGALRIPQHRKGAQTSPSVHV